ncbi:uncharacterized protein F13E9.13, mitochondrial-like isoform X3 [Rhipicephalus microplus]|uniref:uncharacterized protein F13E9.13, mitochondrial-like isoform X3 n=1 Tax=Rhipicephalus microplus TaxID=6941 RepID=UPI003F6C4321
MSSGVKRKASQTHCFAPGCSSGYVSARKSGRQVSLFSVPKDPERFKAWQRAVPRADKPLEATSVLCELHFDEQYLVRFFTHTINGFQFVRAEGFVVEHVADEGIMKSCASELLRYRCIIDAEDILVFADIKKKHCSHAITSDVSILETMKAAEFFQCDGIILTGGATGLPPSTTELQDAVIVGSSFKHGNIWSGALNALRMEAFMEKERSDGTFSDQESKDTSSHAPEGGSTWNW